MSELPKEVRQRTDKLDAVGNTTAAIGKGFAIASAALTAFALFGAFMTTAKLSNIDRFKANVMAGLFIGGCFLLYSPFWRWVLWVARPWSMIEEVRRQFANIPGKLKAALDLMRRMAISRLKSGAQRTDRKFSTMPMAKPNTQVRWNIYAKRLSQMVVPGLMAVIVPVVIAFLRFR